MNLEDSSRLNTTISYHVSGKPLTVELLTYDENPGWNEDRIIQRYECTLGGTVDVINCHTCMCVMYNLKSRLACERRGFAVTLSVIQIEMCKEL